MKESILHTPIYGGHVWSSTCSELRAVSNQVTGTSAHPCPSKVASFFRLDMAELSSQPEMGCQRSCPRVLPEAPAAPRFHHALPGHGGAVSTAGATVGWNRAFLDVLYIE